MRINAQLEYVEEIKIYRTSFSPYKTQYLQQEAVRQANDTLQYRNDVSFVVTLH